MVQKAKTACSPYLLLERRSLRDACRQIAERHGRATVPCGACGLANLCAVRGPVKPTDPARSKHADAARAAAQRR